MGVSSLPETVTRQRCNCDLNPGPSAPEPSMLTTRLPTHPSVTGAYSQRQLSQCTTSTLHCSAQEVMAPSLATMHYSE